jgi:hypothetical protein
MSDLTINHQPLSTLCFKRFPIFRAVISRFRRSCYPARAKETPVASGQPLGRLPERRAAGKRPNLPGRAVLILGALKPLSELRSPAQPRIREFRSPEGSRAANCLSFAVRLGEWRLPEAAQTFR